MCGHARITFFCPEGRKKPEPVSEVWCHEPGCTHHWLLVGAEADPTIRDRLQLRAELQGKLRTPKKVEPFIGNGRWEVCVYGRGACPAPGSSADASEAERG